MKKKSQKKTPKKSQKKTPKKSNSKEFEQLISEIEKLLYQEKASITWNDSIKDPDSPKQKRQIDILIKEKDHTTHIECRIHKKPQDVKWVEELMGRKMSLQVDAIIGVSASGFTQPAIRKARTHGIILRDLRSISRDEIEAWGKVFMTTVEYMHFESITFELYTNDETESISASVDEFDDFIRQHHGIIHQILRPLDNLVNDRAKEQTLSKIFDENKFEIEFGFTLYKPLIFKEKAIHELYIKIPVIRPLRVDHTVSEVALYGSPDELQQDRATSIQKMSETGWQLIDTPLKGKVFLDLMILQPPPNSLICGISISNLTPHKSYDIAMLPLKEEDYYEKIVNKTIKIIKGKRSE